MQMKPAPVQLYNLPTYFVHLNDAFLSYSTPKALGGRFNRFYWVTVA